MGKDRMFKRDVRLDRHGRPARFVTCSDCGREASHASPPGINPILTKKFFERAGWKLGKTAKSDLCDRCQATPKSAKEHAVKKSNVEASGSARSNGRPTAQSIPPTRLIKREDRRVIWSKLEEVYVDEELGYVLGWDDDRLAKDLGVPRAWVTKIRVENFGDKVTNVDLDALKREVGDLHRRTTETMVVMDGLSSELQSIRAKAKEVQELLQRATL